MEGIIVTSYPDTKVAMLFSPELRKRAIVPWDAVVNCSPKRLDCDDVVEFDISRQSGRFAVSHIRILGGKEERRTRRTVEVHRQRVMQQ